MEETLALMCYFELKRSILRCGTLLLTRIFECEHESTRITYNV